MSIKSLYKSEIAAALEVTPQTLRRYLNTQHIQELEKLGYKRHSSLLTGKPLEYVLEVFCLNESDFPHKITVE